jgi:hypothetical protein
MALLFSHDPRYHIMYTARENLNGTAKYLVFFIYLLTEEAALTVLLGLAEDAVTSFWGTNDWSCRLNMHKGQRTGLRVGLVKRAVKKAPLSLVCLSSERWCMDDGC